MTHLTSSTLPTRRRRAGRAGAAAMTRPDPEPKAAVLCGHCRKSREARRAHAPGNRDSTGRTDRGPATAARTARWSVETHDDLDIFRAARLVIDLHSDEIKLDGYRTAARIEDGKVRMLTVPASIGQSASDRLPPRSPTCRSTGRTSTVKSRPSTHTASPTSARYRMRYPRARLSGWSTSPSTCSTSTDRTSANCRWWAARWHSRGSCGALPGASSSIASTSWERPGLLPAGLWAPSRRHCIEAHNRSLSLPAG